jgi:hypothetical protein
MAGGGTGDHPVLFLRRTDAKKLRIETENLVKVLWHCTNCPSEYWKFYGVLTAWTIICSTV